MTARLEPGSVHTETTMTTTMITFLLAIPVGALLALYILFGKDDEHEPGPS